MYMYTESNFSNNASIDYKGPLLLYVKQNNCPACISYNPIFAGLASETRKRQLGLPDSLKFATVVYGVGLKNKSDNRNMTITHTPALIMYYNHEPIAKYSGIGQITEQMTVSFIVNVFKDILKVDLVQQNAPVEMANPGYNNSTNAHPPNAAYSRFEPERFGPTRPSFAGGVKSPGSMYVDEVPAFFDQPQFGSQPPIHAPITWRTKR